MKSMRINNYHGPCAYKVQTNVSKCISTAPKLNTLYKDLTAHHFLLLFSEKFINPIELLQKLGL